MTSIALDYDGTYTINPPFWNTFILNAHQAGLRVFIVTYRDERYDDTEMLSYLKNEMNVPVYFTRGTAKLWYMERFGEPVNIWIDDNPKAIFANSDLTLDEIDTFRGWQVHG